MNYPNVTLRIKNYLPSIELQSDVEDIQTMSVATKGLDTLLTETAAAMGAKWNIDEVKRRISEGDDTFLVFPEIEFESESLDLDQFGDAIQTAVNEYVEFADANEDVRAELKSNWQADVLASLLAQVYRLLAARAVFFASEIGVRDIQLIDDSFDSRLREQMSRDLESLELELTVPENE
jgi:hypothetical protein